MKLFKYLSYERIDVLQNNKIKFSSPADFNDPFEFQVSFSKVIEYDKNFEKQVRLELKKEILRKFESIPKDMCNNILTFKVKRQLIKEIKSQLIKNISDLKNNSEPTLAINASTVFSENLINKIGVLSLTEKSDNLLMWAHYATSHQGYCLGFNSDSNFFNRKRSENDEFYHIRKVIYDKNRPYKPITDLTAQDTFLTKSDDWKYEQEWRMLVSLDDANEVKRINNTNVHLYEFPAEIVTDVILGCNISEKIQLDIVEILKSKTAYKHVKLRKCRISRTEFSLDIIDL